MDNFSRYKIKREIDSGGMATVYLAEDTVLHRDVALKMVHPHLLNRAEAIRRFHNEAKAVATLSHENIVKVFDYGEEEERRYLVMEFIDGVTLSELIDRHGPLPNLIVAEIMSQLLAGLAVAHDKGIYHRDVKPGNIMVDRHGCIRIMDFGIAYLVAHESITLTGTFVGSPNYISPEQAEGREITGKTDVFSLGSLAFQCATGKLPFDAANPHAIIRSIVNERMVPPYRLNPGLLLWLSDLIEKCLTKDVAARLSATECSRLIERHCTDDKLELGRRRLVRFIDNAAPYREAERKELFDIYRTGAREDFRRRRLVQALKKLNQARSLGELPASDLRWASALGRRATLRKLLWAGMVSVAVLGAVTGIALGLRGLNSVRANAVSPVPVVDSVTTFEPATPDNGNETETSAAASSKYGVIEFPNSKQALHETPAPTAAQPARTGAVRTKPVGSRLNDATTGGSAVGYLSLRTNPSWVGITIDGIAAGNTAQSGTIALSAGTHQIVLSKEGFAVVRTEVSIVSGDTTSRKIRMEPLSRSAGRTTP